MEIVNSRAWVRRRVGLRSGRTPVRSRCARNSCASRDPIAIVRSAATLFGVSTPARIHVSRPRTVGPSASSRSNQRSPRIWRASGVRGRRSRHRSPVAHRCDGRTDHGRPRPAGRAPRRARNERPEEHAPRLPAVLGSFDRHGATSCVHAPGGLPPARGQFAQVQRMHPDAAGGMALGHGRALWRGRWGLASALVGPDEAALYEIVKDGRHLLPLSGSQRSSRSDAELSSGRCRTRRQARASRGIARPTSVASHNRRALGAER